MSRVLGVDYGRVRCGLAVSDPLGRTAQPLEVVERPPKGSLVRAVLDVAERVGASKIVVGLPLRMDGSHGVEADAVRAFADALRERSGLVVDLWDERLSTVEASRDMRRAGVSARRQKGTVDKVAAAVVLQAYLESSLERLPHPDEVTMPQETPSSGGGTPDPDDDDRPRRSPSGAKRRRQAPRRGREHWRAEAEEGR